MLESKPADPVEEYLRQIEAAPPVTAHEKRDLWAAMDRGGGDDDAAKQRMIEANLRSVLPIARGTRVGA